MHHPANAPMRPCRTRAPIRTHLALGKMGPRRRRPNSMRRGPEEGALEHRDHARDSAALGPQCTRRDGELEGGGAPATANTPRSEATSQHEDTAMRLLGAGPKEDEEDRTLEPNAHSSHAEYPKQSARSRLDAKMPMSPSASSPYLAPGVPRVHQRPTVRQCRTRPPKHHT